MTLEEAMKVRHKVSKYLDKELPNDIVSNLNDRINENNKKYDLNIKLMTNNKNGLPSIVGALMAKGVKNYIILAGPNTQEVDEKLGYVSSDLMLYAQTLGLSVYD